MRRRRPSLKTILHIGQPKTGTTTIHHAFFNNHERLVERGVLYPRVVPDWRQHSVLIPHLTGRESFPRDTVFRPHWPGDGVMGKSAWFWQQIVAQAATHAPETMVLSGEGYFVQTKPEVVQKLSATLTAQFADVDVVAYLRDPVSLFTSSFQQRLKMGGAPMWFHEEPYRPAITAYRDHGPGPLHLHLFERGAMTGGNVLDDFIARHVPAAGKLRQGPMNTAFSAEAVVYLDRVRAGIAPMPSQMDWPALVGRCQTVDLRLRAPSRLRLDDRGTEHVLRVTRDLTWLSEDAGLRFAGIDYTLAGRSDPTTTPPTRAEEIFAMDPARYGALVAGVAQDETPVTRAASKIAALRRKAKRLTGFGSA